MSRKNIFEMIADIFDISIELNRMFRLVEKKSIIYFQHSTYTLLEYIKYYGFPKNTMVFQNGEIEAGV